MTRADSLSLSNYFLLIKVASMLQEDTILTKFRRIVWDPQY